MIRLVGNKFFSLLLRTLFGVRLTDVLYFYLMGKKEMFQDLDLRSSDFAICVEIPIKVHQMGYKYTEIPSRERRRIAGESKSTPLPTG